MGIYDFSVKKIDNTDLNLTQYRGFVILIVNVASKCGFTKQYEELEELYQRYKDKNFIILGFPCNQFLNQEPESSEHIYQFCRLTYGVSFQILKKIDVNGSNTEPLYQYLKKSAKGILGTQSIKWNFTKFLINRDATKIERFSPTTKPLELISHIDSLLI